MRKPSLVFFALFVSILICESAMAQSTIMNIPSTDVVAAKKVYVEMDFLTNYAWQRQESFQNYIPRVVVGIARNVEAGVNVSFTHIDGEPGQPIEIQPNVKWQFYNNESNGTAASVGCILYVPINHRAGTDTHGFCYVNGSKKFSGRLGTRFTGGAYSLISARKENGDRAGAMIGYEQPLSKRVGLLIDWFSGANRFGYVSPGITIATPGKSALTTGYAIANHGRGKNALFVYYGKQF